MPRVEVDGLEIGYDRAGDGPPIVLLHGAASDARLFRPQLSALADEFTLIAWDEPGAGRSSEPPEHFGLADYADAAAGLIAAIGLDSAQIGGLSWGGVVAQEVYRRHPDRVRSLLLFDTYAGWKGSLSAEECARRRAAALEQASLPPERFEPATALPGMLSEHAAPEVVEGFAEIVSDTDPAALRRVAIAVSECDHRDLLPRIDVPTLLIWGEADARSPLSVAEQFRDAIPDVRLVTIPGAGHANNLEQPKPFNRALREFCREVAAGP